MPLAAGVLYPCRTTAQPNDRERRDELQSGIGYWQRASVAQAPVVKDWSNSAACIAFFSKSPAMACPTSLVQLLLKDGHIILHPHVIRIDGEVLPTVMAVDLLLAFFLVDRHSRVRYITAAFG